jgi:hypothetical protein
MRPVARRRRVLRPLPRRAPGRAPRGLRRAVGALALLAALLALVLLWPRPAPAPPPPSAPRATSAARPAPPPRKPPAHPAPPARLPARAASLARDRLLAAIRERSADLAACETPPGAPTRAPARLRISKAGAPSAVAFEGAPPAPALASCMRERILAWRFDGLELPADVDVMVTFSLAPRLSEGVP